jgi:tetratricopeptide (TPR) repeat protein
LGGLLGCGLMLILRISVILLPAFSVVLVSAANAQQACEIDEAQRLFGLQPRPVAAVERLLLACLSAGATDYRIFMFQGVMARDAGDTDRAIELLQRAHQMAPGEPSPALELAFTLERQHGRAAAGIYEEILSKDPDARPALLGLARVAREQYRLDKAQEIYARLLKKNPQDPDALNGLAWVALANRNREEARAGFRGVLAVDPQNQEAQIGLSKVDEVYRYVLDVNGAFVSTSLGTSWGAGATGLIGITAVDTLELGEFHYTNELQTVTFAGVSVLPTDDVRVGYNRLVPFQYNLSVTYDFRSHTTLPDEHWVEGSAGFYITDYLRWFGSYRQAMGGPQWNGRLIRTGLGVSLSPSWEVTASGFDAAQAIFNNYQNIFSWVVDVAYHGPANTLVVAGVGYSPLFDNIDLHARAIVPVTDRVAVQLAIAHNSINADTRATVGLRFNW